MKTKKTYLKTTYLRLTTAFLLFLFAIAAASSCGGGGGGGPSGGGGGGPTLRVWGTAMLIETDNTGDASAPQIAMDGSGNAIAVWRQLDSTGHYSIWANRYVKGTGWGTAALIETDNAGTAWNPQIAMDSNGNAIAVWQQSTAGNPREDIWANRYVNGAGWGTAALIETNNTGGAYNPQIAMDGSGNAIAVWQYFNGTRHVIWANRYVNGAVWGTAAPIDTYGADALFPQIAMDSSGNAIAVWRQFDGTMDSIWSNRFNVNGTGWDSTAGLIETNDVGNAADPQIAMDGSGNGIAVWRQSDGARYNTCANRFGNSTGWGTTITLIETYDAGDAYASQIAMDGSGNAIAVWVQSDGTRYNIYANRYVNGTGWGTAALIEDNAGDAYGSQIAMDGSGNAIAVWVQFDGTRYNIYANRYVNGTGWGTAELIETDNAGDASVLSLTLLYI